MLLPWALELLPALRALPLWVTVLWPALWAVELSPALQVLALRALTLSPAFLALALQVPMLWLVSQAVDPSLDLWMLAPWVSELLLALWRCYQCSPWRSGH